MAAVTASPTTHYDFFSTTLKKSMTSASQTSGIVLNKILDNDGNARTLTTTSIILRFSRAGKQELISAGGWTQDASGNFTLTDVRRNLDPDDPTSFAAGSNGIKWTAGTRVECVIDGRTIGKLARTDGANTFNGNITIADGINLYFGGTAAYLKTTDSGTNLLLKDGSNSESSLSTALASGNDEKVGVDSAATPGYIGAASNDGVLRTGDGLSYADGGDFVTLDVTKLKDASSTELTLSSGAVTATGSHHTIDTESDAASDDLDTISGGADGDYLTIRAENDARTVVVKHGTGNILTVDGNDFSIDDDDKSITLRYDGTNWREVCRAVVTTTAQNYASLYARQSDASTICQSTTSEETADTFNITANSLAVGDKLIVKAGATSAFTTGTVTVRLKLGGVTATQLAIAFVNGTTSDWFFEAELVVTDADASGAVRAVSVVNVNPSSGSDYLHTEYRASTAQDFTSTMACAITCQHSASNATGTTLKYFTVDQVQAA